MKHWEITDTGLIRHENQDAFGFAQLPGGYAVAVVCDGMGGVAGGSIASTVAVKTFIRTLTETGHSGHTQEGGESFVFGDLVIDTASHSVKIAGEEAPLTPKEFDLLVFLVSNKGLALSREKILQKVWNYDYYGEDRTVDTHVKMLRSHLGKYRDNIVTVWGIGYKFDPDVRPGK